MKNYYPFIFIMIAVFSAALSCNTRDRKAEVESGLRTYDRLIQKMDADSIALMYAPDGDLGTIAHGRDSIRKFLSTFKNVSVLSVSSSSDNIGINNDTAIQKGRFSQVALVNNKDTVRPKGTYIAKWVWIKDEGWKIKTMTTKPDNQ
jgi:ketosteroid isomerase-like protein